MAQDLYQQGYSIYTYDHRGQGLSGRILADRRIGNVNDFDNYVRDLGMFYRQVVVQKKQGSIILLSHSMGGAIAALYLERHPGDLRVAVFSSPMMEINTGIFPVSLVCKTAEWLQGLRQFLDRDPGYVPFTGPTGRSFFPKTG